MALQGIPAYVNDPKLTVGQYIELQLRLGLERAELQGTVTRHIGKIYSVVFSHAATEGDINPPDKLQRLYWQLRQDNLRNQVIKQEHGAAQQTVEIPVPSQQLDPSN